MATGLVAPPIGAGNREIVDAIKRLVLHASDALSGPLLLADGTLSAPGLAFQNDPDVGIYRVGANDAALVANTNKVLEWLYEATAGPRVAIGGVTPAAGLHVSKNESASWLAILANAGTTSTARGVQVSVAASAAATVALEVLGSTTAAGLRVFADLGVVVGASASPGANALQVDGALGVGIAPPVPFAVSKVSTGNFVSILTQLGASAGDHGVRVITTNATTTTQILNLASAGSKFIFYADGGAAFANMTSPGAGWLALGGGVYFNGATDWPVRRRDLTLAAAATSQLHPTVAAASGHFQIHDDRGYVATYASDGGGTPRLNDGDAAIWSVTSGTVTHNNVYFTGGALTIQNNSGGARTYIVLMWSH